MKWSLIILFLFSLVGCDPHNFGFKNNPDFILDEVFKSVQNQDVVSFLEFTGKEAFCIYGNESGMAYLKSKTQVDPNNFMIDLGTPIKTSFTAPEYVNYWSYYRETFTVSVTDVKAKKLALEAIVECNWGTDGQRDPKNVHLKKSKFRNKSCRLVKLVPKAFEPMNLPEKCASLKVNL
jgi:hypothetical protein